ncbi:MAG: squalene--hopene cyclase, partial [Planctomycetota bacterium]|nr:squalene--hopene cyclase [Planctomycetota bacterium]
HPVTQRGVGFILQSVREDGSWPIDTNLATWVTTLSVNALADDVPTANRADILKWVIEQQYRVVHPYTNADPGGWAWTDLPGGVPDADDTPGGILAVLNLRHDSSNDSEQAVVTRASLTAAVRWLLDLQNRDAGWPTFCRGWGKLPFDRSSADISAHVIRALYATSELETDLSLPPALQKSAVAAMSRGFKFLETVQRSDGSWLPLWFGNQFVSDDENPTYGTARVLMAYRDTVRLQSAAAQRGLDWLIVNQNDDGGWGGSRGIESSVEESSLAIESLIGSGFSRQFEPGEGDEPDQPRQESIKKGLAWLMSRVESGTVHQPTPIGFYFAKLWYFESLYPLIFAVSALRRAVLTGCLADSTDSS